MSGGAIREYLLFSQIPHARKEQVLGILAGITGNQPTAFTQQVVIYAQLTAPDTTASKKVCSWISMAEENRKGDEWK